MKIRLIAALAVAGIGLSVSAAPIGPFYVKIGTGCIKAKVFVGDDGAIFGNEVGCSARFNSPWIGGADRSGTIYLANSDPSIGFTALYAVTLTGPTVGVAQFFGANSTTGRYFGFEPVSVSLTP
jgi:hypothetical protein